MEYQIFLYRRKFKLHISQQYNPTVGFCLPHLELVLVCIYKSFSTRTWTLLSDISDKFSNCWDTTLITCSYIANWIFIHFTEKWNNFWHLNEGGPLNIQQHPTIEKVKDLVSNQTEEGTGSSPSQTEVKALGRWWNWGKKSDTTFTSSALERFVQISSFTLGERAQLWTLRKYWHLFFIESGRETFSLILTPTFSSHLFRHLPTYCASFQQC